MASAATFPGNPNGRSAGTAIATRANPFDLNMNPGYGIQGKPMDGYLDTLAGGAPDLSLGDPERQFVSHTMASILAAKSNPVVIRELVVQAINDAMYDALEVCPLEFVTDHRYMSGVATSRLKYNADYLLPQPENTAPALITASYESVSMQLDRKGLGFEVMDDRSLTPEGVREFMGKLQALISDAGNTVKLCAFQGILAAHRPKSAVAERYGISGADVSRHDERNRQFGMLQKETLAWNRLLTMAHEANSRQQALKDFTHVFVSTRVINQCRYGDSGQYEYYKHGPGNRKLIDNPTSSIPTGPRGPKMVEVVPAYPRATDLAPGEPLDLLEQRVNVGTYFLSLVENVDVYPQKMGALDVYSIDFNTGDGQIRKQSARELLRHAICWDPETGRLDAIYNTLTSGNTAQDYASRRHIPTTPGPVGGALFDPWIVQTPNGTEIVRMVGNQDPHYLDTETIRLIGKMAMAQASKEWTQADTDNVMFAKKFAEANRNPENIPWAQDFIVVVANFGAPRNEFGTYDIPDLAALSGTRRSIAPAATDDERKAHTLFAAGKTISRNSAGIFPGYGSMQHLRTVRKWLNTSAFDALVALPDDAARGIIGDGADFRIRMNKVKDGIDAMEKLSRIMQRLFSVTDETAANLLFRENSLPWWNRGYDKELNKLDAMVQSIILGIHYPVGLIPAPGDADDAANVTYANVDAALITALGLNGVTAFAGLGPREIIAMVNSVPQFRRRCGEILSIQEAQPLMDELRSVGQGEDDIDIVRNLMMLKLRTELGGEPSPDEAAEAIGTLYSLYKYQHDHQEADFTSETYMILAIAAATKKREELGGRRVTNPGGGDVEVQPRNRKRNRNDADRNADERADNVVNTYLTLSQEFFVRYYAQNIPGQRYLTPTDPEAPGLQWLWTGVRDVYDFNVDNVADAFAAKYARSEYSIDTTCLGKHAASAFTMGDPDGRPSKRARVDAPHVSGASYGDAVDDTPIRDPRGVRTRVDPRLRSTAPAKHVAPPGDPTNPIAMNANGYFLDRWEDVLMYSGNLLQRVCEQLLLTQYVHRDSFCNMLAHNIPAPMGMIVVNPYIELSMTHVVFAVAGCGKTYYAFPQLTAGYDPMHKKTIVNLTMWVEGFVDMPEQVYVAENVSFNKYIKGGGHSLVSKIKTGDERQRARFGRVDNNGEDEYDFDPKNVSARKADRFVLHTGASTRNGDVPDPIPLAGYYPDGGSYRGDGTCITRSYTHRGGGALFHSALFADMKCGFAKTNSSNHMAEINDPSEIAYAKRKDNVARSWCTTVYRGDQYLADPVTGAININIQRGGGLLGKLTQGVVKILDGEPGTIADHVEKGA